MVSVDADDLMSYGDDGAEGFAYWWAAENLDGGMEVSDIEISPGDIERVEAWMEDTYEGGGY